MTIPFNTYLFVTHNPSGETYTREIADDEPLCLKTILVDWIEQQFCGELHLLGELCRYDGEYTAAIYTDNRQPHSAVVWDSKGFYVTTEE